MINEPMTKWLAINCPESISFILEDHTRLFLMEGFFSSFFLLWENYSVTWLVVKKSQDIYAHVANYSIIIFPSVNELAFLNKNISISNVKFLHIFQIFLCNIQKLALKNDILCGGNLNEPLIHIVSHPTRSSVILMKNSQ